MRRVRLPVGLAAAARVGMRIELEITQEHINRAMRARNKGEPAARSCALAQALKGRGARAVHVGGAYAEDDGHVYHYGLDAKALVRRIEAGAKLEPCTVSLERVEA